MTRIGRQASASLGGLRRPTEQRSDGAGWQTGYDARAKFVCLVAYTIAALHARTPVALGACVAAAIVMAAMAHLPLRSAVRAIRPLAAILLVTAIMQVLYIRQGEVLAQFGSVSITQGALFAATAMVAVLVCVMVASLAFMRSTPSDQLVSTLDWLLGPLRALGMRTAPFMLALMVAFRFIPVLADEFGQLKKSQVARGADFGGTLRKRLSAYARLFPPLVRSSFRRADRIADTFVSRCFTSAARSRATLHPQRFHRRDLVLVAATAAFVAAVALM